MKLCQEKDCVGCLACVNSCSWKALTIQENSEGFAIPRLNLSLCRNCGACSRACPILQQPAISRLSEPVIYSGWATAAKVRSSCSSGGAFYILAERILATGGVVFGASFGPNLEVMHTWVEHLEDLPQLTGSKYVQSNIGDSFIQAKKFLEQKRQVLFSGTPCQIAGLQKFLAQKYPTLLTVDLICHGVPSPMIFREYKQYMEKRFNSRIVRLKFRDKAFSWIYFNMQILFENQQQYIGTYFEDPYLRGFLQDLFLRPSCHNCLFAKVERMGDITIADWWQYEKKNKEDRNFNTLGVSLLMCNTEYGKIFFDTCKEKFQGHRRSLAEALKTNVCLQHSFPPSEKREKFWADHNSLSFPELIDKYMFPKPLTPIERLLSTRKQTAEIKIKIFCLRVWNWSIRKIKSLTKAK